MATEKSINKLFGRFGIKIGMKRLSLCSFHPYPLMRILLYQLNPPPCPPSSSPGCWVSSESSTSEILVREICSICALNSLLGWNKTLFLTIFSPPLTSELLQVMAGFRYPMLPRLTPWPSSIQVQADSTMVSTTARQVALLIPERREICSMTFLKLTVPPRTAEAT